MPRGWKDWVRGIAIWGIGPNDELTRIRTDERGYLQVLQVPHHYTHEDGGSDEINVQGLSGVLADLQRGKFSFVGNYADFPAPGEPERLAFAVDRLTVYRDTGTEWQKVATAHWDYLEGAPSDFFPAPHAATHEEGGSDAINPANIGANWDKLVNVPSTFPPSAHASSHRPGGSDALPTAIPSPITEGATGGEGSSTTLARADHVHETPGEWTPKVHGNEAHNPDFLAVDGSNKMEGALSGNNTYPVLQNFSLLLSEGSGIVRLNTPYLFNDIAFNLERGGSVSFSPSPTYGEASYLFDGTGSYVEWINPSGTITIEIDWCITGYWVLNGTITMEEEFRAKHVKVELWDDTAGQWVTVKEVTDWPYALVAWTFRPQGHAVTKMRITFSDFSDPVHFRVGDIAVTKLQGLLSASYLLSRGGGDMYGDIDMHGNDIVNPGLVDGVDVSNHAARHHEGGADQIDFLQLKNHNHAARHQVGGADEVRPGKYANTVIFSSSSTTPTGWTTLSTGVGTRAFVVLRIYNTSGANRTFYLMPGDDSVHPQSDVNYSAALSSVRVNNANMAYTAMITDASGRIKWYCDQAVTGIEVKLMGYIKLI